MSEPFEKSPSICVHLNGDFETVLVQRMEALRAAGYGAGQFGTRDPIFEELSNHARTAF